MIPIDVSSCISISLYIVIHLLFIKLNHFYIRRMTSTYYRDESRVALICWKNMIVIWCWKLTIPFFFFSVDFTLVEGAIKKNWKGAWVASRDQGRRLDILIVWCSLDDKDTSHLICVTSSCSWSFLITMNKNNQVLRSIHWQVILNIFLRIGGINLQ